MPPSKAIQILDYYHNSETLFELVQLQPKLKEKAPHPVQTQGCSERSREPQSGRYPWAQEIVEGWKRSVDAVMQQDRKFLEEIIPTFTPTTHYNLTCPACVGKQSRMGRAQFSWGGPEAPEEVTCNDCGTTYPNEAYPETGVLELPRMGQTIPYYETPGEREHPEERAKYAFTTAPGQPMMTSFSGLARLYRARWAAGQALMLAKLYVLTGETACVERCVWILDRFVQDVPPGRAAAVRAGCQRVVFAGAWAFEEIWGPSRSPTSNRF